ncbi:MAG TPA: hypothetical protein VL977_04940 [Solirubrobacteraceae bacterium]|nr:hypothetical protein [Solirubrobacteraceae bacterium]
MEPYELSHGLWRWTAPHPEWQPGAPGSAYDWPRDVGCALFQTSSTALFVDPQLPGDAKRFWQWADDACRGRSVAVLTTIRYHARSRAAVIERYGASSYGPDARDEQVLPGGVQTFPVPSLDEVVVWLASQRTLIAGDVIVGAAGGGLRICPETWFDDIPVPVPLEELRAELEPLLALPVETVLVAHGEPVLAGARAALADALRPAAGLRQAS